MDHLVFHFKIEPYDEAYSDVLASELCDVGFDSFETISNELTGYIRSDMADLAAIDSLLSTYPIPGVRIRYDYTPVPSADWNSCWESSFEPISIDDLAYIHSPSFPPKQGFQYDIVISPQMAFGSGSHSTTRLMLRLLLSPSASSSSSAPPPSPHSEILSRTTVLDIGSGTGILGIAALLGGCEHLTAIDIDTDSVRNTLENLSLNSLHNYDVREGDLSVISSEQTFDIVLSNIHLNVHLSQMASYSSHLNPGGRLLLSGFFTSDSSELLSKASLSGLELTEMLEENEWCAMSFRKNPSSL